MMILASNRKGYISKQLEIIMHNQKRATFEAAFLYLHFLVDLVFFVKVFIHLLSLSQIYNQN